MFKLSFATDNAAFDGYHDTKTETASILRRIADAIEHGTSGAPIHDSNGNRIGRFDLTIAPDPHEDEETLTQALDRHGITHEAAGNGHRYLYTTNLIDGGRDCIGTADSRQGWALIRLLDSIALR